MDRASATKEEAIGSTGESVDDEGDEDETKALVAEGVGRLSPTGLADGRSLLAESYDELRLSINEALEKIDPRAAVLIGKGQRHIDVMLGGRTKYSVSPMRLDVSEKGLDLPPPADAFATYEEIDTVLDHLDKALGRADRAAASYCRDAQYLIARMKADLAASNAA